MMQSGMQPNQLLTLVVVSLVLLLILSLYRRREGITHFLRRTFLAEAAYLLLAWYLAQRGIPPVAAIGIGVLAAVTVAKMLVAPRSRYIRASEKRKAIVDYERKTGRKYDRKTDEFDHEIAFAKGGSSTSDNLRVRSRTENRRKGKKSPWWDVLGR
jgi:hypothetical protein